jgi:hypothetical protein
MKTAMQELIEIIGKDYDAMEYMLVINFKSFLEKEKEKDQIEGYRIIIEELRKAHTQMQKEIIALKMNKNK